MGFGLLEENQHDLGTELGIWGLVLRYLQVGIYCGVTSSLVMWH